jgi:prepilin-type N-terminal cleavage/methylation domain-containing protein/prepilin-type processing-associated H-X9-DG protein
MKRAFTLIELLVVIAIIAILAAILFPVFAQAKEAAKKTTDLSQVKQQALAATMYSGDVDDMVVRHMSPATGDAQGSSYWTRSVQPYMKNWQMFRSPKDQSNPYGIWTAGSRYYWDGNWQNWGLGYGMNVEYLNNAGGDCSGWINASGFGLPIALTSVAAPAETVFATDKKNIGNDATGWYTGAWVGAPATPFADDACGYSNAGWGSDAFGDSMQFAPPANTGTGNVAAHWSGGTVVAFIDGHVKFMMPGALAVGTNWKKGATNSQIAITDRARYLWDTQQ